MKKEFSVLVFLFLLLNGSNVFAQNPFLVWSGGIDPCGEITISYSCIGAIGAHDYVVASNIPNSIGEEAGDYTYFPQSLSPQTFSVTSSTGGTSTIVVSPQAAAYSYVQNDTVYAGTPVPIYWAGTVGTVYTTTSWKNGNFGTSSTDTLYPQATTTFCITAHFSCGEITTCKTIVVQEPLFLQQDTTKDTNNCMQVEEIMLYPNPAADFFSIKGDYKKMRLYDSIGRLIMEDEKAEKHFITNLSNEIYNVFIIKEGGEVVNFLMQKN